MTYPGIEMKKKSISVIIPVYNEVESLPQLIKQLIESMASYNNWEVLFIDDGYTIVDDYSGKSKEPLL